MQREEERPRLIPGDRARLMSMPTTAPLNAARESPLDATDGCRPHLSAHSRRMRSVFTTCTAMSCNGCRDCFAESYSGLPTDGSAYEEAVQLKTHGPFPSTDMAGTNSCACRMVRGGDWGDPPATIRSASRNFGPGPGATLQDYRSGGVGFRVARTLD
jgi:Uncharacterized conserved protein